MPYGMYIWTDIAAMPGMLGQAGRDVAATSEETDDGEELHPHPQTAYRLQPVLPCMHC